jgi:hypothetical protein
MQCAGRLGILVSRRNQREEISVVTWDIDRYQELQDTAWELDAWANEQDTSALRHGRRSEGDANRARAAAKRVEAAHLLAQYWVLPRTLTNGRSSVRFQ